MPPRRGLSGLVTGRRRLEETALSNGRDVTGSVSGPGTGPLWLDVSLWSADLGNLQSEIARLETVADSFHLDAADGHWVPALLFFPDLVARLRPLTRVEFHLHLMATRPLDLLPAFLDAGVDRVTLPVELGKRVRPALDRVRAAGRRTGISLALDTPVDWAKPFLGSIDTIVMMGTEVGVKGCGLDPRACGRLKAMRDMGGGRLPLLVADGGIRAETVPLLRGAGAAGIVPGSLVCASEDPQAAAAWLRSL
jgi:ribulose-phosphate 3-epimerase